MTTFLLILISTMLAMIFILNEIIKAAVRKGIQNALKKELFSLKAYKIAELKRMGIKEKEIEEAKNYLHKRKQSNSNSEDYWNKIAD